MNAAPAAPTAVLADDEPALADYLRRLLREAWPELRVLGVAHQGLEALRLVDELAPDLAFLDIRMPAMSGLDVAARLAGRDDAPLVVFVTAHDEHAIEAFEREAVDYVLKPPTAERLARTVATLKRRLAERAAGRGPSGGDDLVARLAAALSSQGGLPGAVVAPPRTLEWIRAADGAGTRLIPVDEVLYFEARDKYVSVFTHEGESLIRLTLRELLDQLDPARFWQVHRGTIVGVRHVAGTTRDLRGRTMVRFRGREEQVVVSRQYEHLFRQM